MMMPTFKREKEKECIVRFGTSGWSEWQFWYMEKGRFNPEKMIEYLKKFIPQRSKGNDPRNDRISFLEVYRLEDEWKEPQYKDNKPLC